MLIRLLPTLAPHQQVWGDTEDIAVVVLLAVAVVLTLVVAGVFAFILTRKK